MPYLQLELNDHFPTATKRVLAARLSETYAETMSMDMRRISVAIRELGEGGLWRMIDGEAEPASILMCDIRQGRPAELRMTLAKQLIAVCVDTLGLREDRINVEFTQHAGDEMYHPTLGGYSPEWPENDGE